ncbi:hypothetical protein MRB53_006386 [Persea americana]|uniref:Uncharacterized protein n=1 Tax=Persea americana TaxID=3435 RepID=A0ACC2MGX8_PERAE|nr:hypothetical protein MRB53_006386 [Persea americana]
MSSSFVVAMAHSPQPFQIHIPRQHSLPQKQVSLDYSKEITKAVAHSKRGKPSITKTSNHKDREISSPSGDTPSNTVTLQVPQPVASYTIADPVAHTPQAAVSSSSIDYTHSSPSTAVPSRTLAEPTTTSSPTHHHLLTYPSTTVPCSQTLYDYKNSNWP